MTNNQCRARCKLNCVQTIDILNSSYESTIIIIGRGTAEHNDILINKGKFLDYAGGEHVTLRHLLSHHVGVASPISPIWVVLSRVPILPWDDPVGGPALAIHLAQITSEVLRAFEGGEVTALLMFHLEDEFAQHMCPSVCIGPARVTATRLSADATLKIMLGHSRRGHADEFCREVRHADGDRHPLDADVRVPGSSTSHLVVDPRRCRWACAREPVDGNPL